MNANEKYKNLIYSGSKVMETLVLGGKSRSLMFLMDLKLDLYDKNNLQIYSR